MPLPGVNAAALAEVIITHKLGQRPYRGPNYQIENAALVALMSALATSPQRVLELLTQSALTLCRAGSAGISIEEGRDPGAVFRWHAVTGKWSGFSGATLPRWHSPCATVLEQNRPLLMHDLNRFYAIPDTLQPPVQEVLLVPFKSGPASVGTLWVVSHEPACIFDREDLRLAQSLAAFAGAAYQCILAADVRPG